MNIYRIVLTGGPCAGKTTACNTIKKYLKDKNIPCLVVPETATELIPNIVFKEIRNLYEFQELVMKRQLVKEVDTLLYARNNYKDYDKCVIIYDRGLFDNCAYLESINDFRRLLSRFDLDEVTSLERYDMVIDLLSLATCKESEYNLSNEARTEDVSYARILDNKTSNVWANHHNLKILRSDVSLKEESENIINLVNNLLEDKVESKVLKYEVDKEKSDLSRYMNDSYLYVTNHVFDMYNGYLCNVAVRTRDLRYASYILEIYTENDNERKIVHKEIVDTDILGDLCRKYKFVNSFSAKEYNFVENGILYKLSVGNESTYLEIIDSDKVIVPSDIVVSKNKIKRK